MSIPWDLFLNSGSSSGSSILLYCMKIETRIEPLGIYPKLGKSLGLFLHGASSLIDATMCLQGHTGAPACLATFTVCATRNANIGRQPGRLGSLLIMPPYILTYAPFINIFPAIKLPGRSSTSTRRKVSIAGRSPRCSIPPGCLMIIVPMPRYVIVVIVLFRTVR
ncbi:hypothetical protein F4802DRAFT_292872 [Xylaria palmicola]|nr:hypothetical protein F4802DRAFT_292872 [Xylaria palmicola]